MPGAVTDISQALSPRNLHTNPLTVSIPIVQGCSFQNLMQIDQGKALSPTFTSLAWSKSF